MRVGKRIAVEERRLRIEDDLRDGLRRPCHIARAPIHEQVYDAVQVSIQLVFLHRNLARLPLKRFGVVDAFQPGQMGFAKTVLAFMAR